MMKTRHVAATAIAILAAGFPVAAQAYVGPGAGLSLVAAFWAVLVAVGAILAFTLMWPVRRLLRHRGMGGRRSETSSGQAPGQAPMARDRGGRGG